MVYGNYKVNVCSFNQLWDYYGNTITMRCMMGILRNNPNVITMLL